MPKCLNLTIAGIVACLIVGCATQSKPTLVSGQLDGVVGPVLDLAGGQMYWAEIFGRKTAQG